MIPTMHDDTRLSRHAMVRHGSVRIAFLMRWTKCAYGLGRHLQDGSVPRSKKVDAHEHTSSSNSSTHLLFKVQRFKLHVFHLTTVAATAPIIFEEKARFRVSTFLVPGADSIQTIFIENEHARSQKQAHTFVVDVALILEPCGRSQRYKVK